MTEDRKTRYKSILLNKKTLVVAAAAIVMTITLSTSAFFNDNSAAKGYEKNQALSGTNDCGSGELPLNVLCNNVGSEIQGDENAAGLSTFQQGGAVQQEPYENLVKEMSMQSVLDAEKEQASKARMSSLSDSISSDFSSR